MTTARKIQGENCEPGPRGVGKDEYIRNDGGIMGISLNRQQGEV